MKKSVIVHMVGNDEGARLPEGEVKLVRTRCGRSIDHPVVTANVGPTRYDLVARNGNQFFCTTRKASVTCQKCSNLLTVGTIYAKQSSRAAVAQKRTVAHAHTADARAARANSRTLRGA